MWMCDADNLSKGATAILFDTWRERKKTEKKEKKIFFLEIPARFS